MEHNSQTNDVFPTTTNPSNGMLNVLIILTFIRCGISYRVPCSATLRAPKSKSPKYVNNRKTWKEADSPENLWKVLWRFSKKSYDYKNLLLASGLIFTTLCLIGAIRMRKLRKSGYFIYVVGKLAPIVIAIGLFGSSFFGAISVVFSAIFAVLFVILYSTQLKYLVNK